MGQDYSLLFIPEKMDYIPDNDSIAKFVEYLEERQLIAPTVDITFRQYFILKRNQNDLMVVNKKAFNTWMELKEGILLTLQGDFTNISFIVEISSIYRNLFLKHINHLILSAMCFGVRDPPRKYFFDEAYEKGTTYFYIDTQIRSGPGNLNEEKNFFQALKRDNDFMKMFHDFEEILQTKLKIESDWS